VEAVRWLYALLFVALALRVGYLVSQRDDLLFEHPILDEQRYVDAARQGENRPYWQPPGVIYATALALKISPSLWAPRLVQSLVSTASVLILFLLARRFFSQRIALAAAAILALHGVVIYQAWEILPATWILFFDLLALLLIEMEYSFFGGLALGVSAIFSPVILPFVPFAAWRLRRPRRIALLLAGVLLPILPVTIHNYSFDHELIPVATNGGLNLYIGNNENYDQTFALRPGRHWEELTSEPERAGIRLPGAQSSYFTRKALAFMSAHPARAAGLYLRKLYLYFNGGEIARDSSIALSWFHFPDGILIPLALAGALLIFEKRLWLLFAFVAVQAAVTAAFFVSARHRLPVLPLFALLAAAGAARLNRRSVAALVILLVLLNFPTRESKLSLAAEKDFYRGVACLREKHDPAGALEYFRAATNSGDERAWFELGNSYSTLGRLDEAIDAYGHAAAIDPWDSRAFRRKAIAQTKKDDLKGAAETLRTLIDSHQHEPSHYDPDRNNLEWLEKQLANKTTP
jgi:tetratricopeptide (TPR) repeat protein